MPRKKKAPEPLAHILFADAERQNLQRRLLRHIVALRLKELDSLASLENLLAYDKGPRFDLNVRQYFAPTQEQPEREPDEWGE